MAETKGTSWDEVQSLLEKHARRACSAAAGKVRDDLFKEAQSAIAAFYAEKFSYNNNKPEPLYYRRHKYNFEKKSFKKYYSQKHSTIYYGGIKLTPEAMNPMYQDNTEEVFDSVFAGFHGPAGMYVSPNIKNTPPRTWPSPMKRLIDKYSDIKEHEDEYKKYGKKIAKRDVPIRFS